MPRESWKTKFKAKRTKGSSKERKSDNENDHQDVANVNSKHILVEENSEISDLRETIHTRQKPKVVVKSKVVKVPPKQDKRVVESKLKQHKETVRFEEEGEIIEMEIDDGREAQRQFRMDEDELMENDLNEMNEEHNSDETSESEVDSAPEDGEILNTQDDKEDQQLINMNEPEVLKQKMSQDSEQGIPSSSTGKRHSVEEWLDTMSSTLLAMKQIMEKSGLLDTTPNKRK